MERTSDPIHQRALDLVDDGYLVTVIPVTDKDGNPGVFCEGHDLGKHELMRAACLSPCVKHRLAAILGVTTAAHVIARRNGFNA